MALIRRKYARGSWCVGGLLHLVIVAAIVLSLMGCGGTSSPVVSATDPGRSPTPTQVVSAYLTALDGGDGSAALALATPRYQAALKAEADSPLTNWGSVRNARIGAPRRDQALVSARHHRQVLYVPVHFTLRQRQELSRLDGETTWGYVLVRDAASDPWLIDDAGVG